jgi:uncharacterized protein YjiS (DUF1127 family)
VSISTLLARREAETQLRKLPTWVETQMALADFAPVASSSSISSLVRAIAGWFAARRAAHARDVVLDDLLFMPEHRLRDLGIDPRTLHQGIDVRYWPTRK